MPKAATLLYQSLLICMVWSMLNRRGAFASGPEYVAVTRKPLSLVSTEYA
jgi:hypothetical protein